MASRPTASRGSIRALESGINKAAADFTIAQERGGRRAWGVGIEGLMAGGVNAAHAWFIRDW